ncbi:MAG: 16S rRNA (uracil(1498)-N(3))-methyltransferase, partial [Gloeobacteraceae cyanobacterium ES-bin-316]|nr:16S rRNA (uracil(1498)-N(3))-methyltransferase [Ferruginibacter sp.]
MKLPLFYKPGIHAAETEITLDEPASKHIVQVLRMQLGEKLQLTDGVGNLFTVTITDDNRKKCTVTILQKSEIQNPKSAIIIAISPVKNTSRYEWFLEKATEIGVTAIVPLLCERTEKQHLKWDRLQGILVSAMLQSQQAWLPLLHEPVKFASYIKEIESVPDLHKMIAHCEDQTGKHSLTKSSRPGVPQLILIGP